jgi:cytochrome b561
MKQILAVLAPATCLALLTAFCVGLASQAMNGLRSTSDSIYLMHFTLGLFAVLFALGVHSLIFIYFLGTGRWVKEVALAYGIADSPLPKLTRDLKRRTFPPALIAMLVPIATAAAGAAVQWRDVNWSFHFSLGVATLAINVWAFWVEYRNVSINVDVIEEVLREVDRIRAAHGLSSNAEALRQEQA